jgi:hypothetical protein
MRKLPTIVFAIALSFALIERSAGQLHQPEAFDDHPAIARAVYAEGPRHVAEGVVRDIAGKPIAGATVWILGDPFDETFPLSPARLLQASKTDKTGRFAIEFQRLELGSHSMLVAKAGFSSIRSIIIPERGKIKNLDLKLEPERVIEGSLRPPVDSEATDITVQVKGYECGGLFFEVPIQMDPLELDKLGLRTRSDNRGQFILTGLPAACNEVWVTIDDPRFAPVSAVRALGETMRANDGVCLIPKAANATPPRIEVPLSAPRWVGGTVRAKSNGEPIPDAWVGVTVMEHWKSGDSHPLAIWSKADRQGKYRVRVGPWGANVAVYVMPPNGAAVPDCLFFDRSFPVFGDEMEFNCDMPEGVLIQGRVVDRSTHQGIAGVSIISMLNRELARNVSRETALGIYWANEYHRRYTDADGYFQQPVAKGELTHLMLRSPHGDYSSSFISGEKMMTKEEIDGGVWYVMEAYRRLSSEETQTSRNIEIEMTPGVVAKGIAKTPSNTSVSNGVVFRDKPLHTHDNQATGFVLWGESIVDGRFAVDGCSPTDPTNLYFLDADEGTGALVRFDPSMQSAQELDVAFQPCGSARVQLLDSSKSPLRNVSLNGDLICEVAIVFRETSTHSKIMTPFWNYQVASHQIDPIHSAVLKTDGEGFVTFPNLIPAAKYRLIFRRNATFRQESGAFERDFVVKPGEILELGQAELPKVTQK